MSLLSVTARELRAEARRPFNYWAPRLSGCAAIVVLLLTNPSQP